MFHQFDGQHFAPPFAKFQIQQATPLIQIAAADFWLLQTVGGRLFRLGNLMKQMKTVIVALSGLLIRRLLQQLMPTQKELEGYLITFKLVEYIGRDRVLMAAASLHSFVLSVIIIIIIIIKEQMMKILL